MYDIGIQQEKGPNTRGIFVTIIIVFCVIGAGLWFGSSWLERQKWEDRNDDLQDEKGSLQEANQRLEDQKDDLQDNYDSLNAWYDDIREEVNQRFGDWGNEKLFVTPDDEAVSAKVLEITGGYNEDNQWSDYKLMYDWVVDNIKYNYDSRLPYLPSVNGSVSWFKDYWRMPSETLGDEGGDCEDMATLLASMLISYTDKYERWCIRWTSDESAHIAVAFPVAGDKLTILDPAGHYSTGSCYSLGSDDIADAVDDWLDHWKHEPGIYVSCVFSDTVYETFTSTNEFVAWALAQ